MQNQNKAKIQKVVPVKKNGYVLELQVPPPQNSLSASSEQSYLLEERQINIHKELPTKANSSDEASSGSFMRNLFRR